MVMLIDGGQGAPVEGLCIQTERPNASGAAFQHEHTHTILDELGRFFGEHMVNILNLGDVYLENMGSFQA